MKKPLPHQAEVSLPTHLRGQAGGGELSPENQATEAAFQPVIAF